MVGREVFMQVEKEEAKPTEKVLEVKNLWVHDARGLLAVKNLSLDVHKGEIVGIAGVDGNGQTELVEALSGLRPTSKGIVASCIPLMLTSSDVCQHIMRSMQLQQPSILPSVMFYACITLFL